MMIPSEFGSMLDGAILAGQCRGRRRARTAECWSRLHAVFEVREPGTTATEEVRARMRSLIGIAAMAIVAWMPAALSAQDPGKKIYDTKCVTCHGPDGKGNKRSEQVFKKKIPDFTLTDLGMLSGPEREKKEQTLRKAIAEAQPPMVVFVKALSEPEKDSVFNYILKTFMKGGQ